MMCEVAPAAAAVAGTAAPAVAQKQGLLEGALAAAAAASEQRFQPANRSHQLELCLCYLRHVSM